MIKIKKLPAEYCWKDLRGLQKLSAVFSDRDARRVVAMEKNRVITALWKIDRGAGPEPEYYINRSAIKTARFLLSEGADKMVSTVWILEHLPAHAKIPREKVVNDPRFGGATKKQTQGRMALFTMADAKAIIKAAVDACQKPPIDVTQAWLSAHFSGCGFSQLAHAVLAAKDAGIPLSKVTHMSTNGRNITDWVILKDDLPRLRDIGTDAEKLRAAKENQRLILRGATREQLDGLYIRLDWAINKGNQAAIDEIETRIAEIEAELNV